MGSGNEAQKKRLEQENYRRRLEEQEAQSRSEWTPSKAAAGAAGYGVGVLGGGLVGAHRTVKDLQETLALARALVDPIDQVVSPPGQSAWQKLGRGIAKGVENFTVEAPKRLFNPVATAKDFWSAGGDALRKASPVEGPAPTASEQYRRGLRRGAKAGDLGFEVGMFLASGPEIKTLRELGYLGRAPTVAERVAKGASPELARYLDEPYPRDAMGSHGMFPRSSRLPDWFLDSKWNRTMPAPGATKGQMFEHHFKIDPNYNGGRVKAQYGGGGWSGRRLGWTKNSRIEQIWRGIPLRTKAAVYGLLTGGAGSVNPFLGSEEEDDR